MSEQEQEAWSAVRESNRARVTGATRELSALLDPEAVVAPPGFSSPIRGREAVVRAVEDERQHARVESYEELEHSVTIFGDLAMVTYRYEMRFRPVKDEEEREESGQEVVALRRSGGRWKVLWRTRLGD